MNFAASSDVTGFLNDRIDFGKMGQDAAAMDTYETNAYNDFQGATAQKGILAAGEIEKAETVADARINAINAGADAKAMGSVGRMAGQALGSLSGMFAGGGGAAASSYTPTGGWGNFGSIQF